MTDNEAAETLAVRGRRLGRREEFAEQARLVAMLQELLDPSVAFFSALENRPRSALAGLLQKRRGVRAGLPPAYLRRIGRVARNQSEIFEQCVRVSLFRQGRPNLVCRPVLPSQRTPMTQKNFA
jgi:hypothetical protein